MKIFIAWICICVWMRIIAHSGVTQLKKPQRKILVHLVGTVALYLTNDQLLQHTNKKLLHKILFLFAELLGLSASFNTSAGIIISKEKDLLQYCICKSSITMASTFTAKVQQNFN
uniref:Secreted protein n=1 Tax=Glossina brevipalpis TaxID=37001 RepID=A0A1A9X2R1_9MUSC